MPVPTTQVAFRFPDELLKRLDRFVEQKEADQRGVRFTRADAVRLFVEDGLQRAGYSPPRKKRSSR